ncbi:MAG: hypothetical protein HOP08_03420 [Cyclobacteriaceae bacterium]|nr:hypothetical protein [Cyclobacteriaceae bacterium]
MMTDIAGIYKERVKGYSERLTEIDRRIRQIALQRLMSILFTGVCLYLGFRMNPLSFFPAVGFFSLFLFLVKKHTLTFRKRVILAELLSLNKKEAAFKEGDKSVFDAGIDFDTSHHLYALDLDIYGTGSLFQSVNRSATTSGRELLSQNLLNPLTNKEEIIKRADSIHDLAKEIDWRQEFTAIGSQLVEKPKDYVELKEWLAIPDFFIGRGHWRPIMWIMPAISAGGILYCIFTSQFIALLVFGPFAINTFLLSLLLKPLKEYFLRFGGKTKQFKKYADLFAHIREGKFKTPQNKALQEQCTDASEAFAKLFKLSNAADQRLGAGGPIMNGLFLMDLWNVLGIEQWKDRHKDSFPQWIDSLVTIDMLSSFSNFTFNHPDFVNATISEGKEFISAKEMGHPLMDTQVSIKNDYDIGVQSKVHVITGSNMAGKSTFIRALGVNLVLACNGVPVCAKEFKCSILGLITSIRITDSLEENASYFKAELIRLERVLDQLKTGKPYLVLLDEILRGTNSDDKRLGTQSFLLKLKQYNCLVLLATHDLSIGKLEKEFPGEVENYCFESQFSEDGLSFDYKLRKGVSSSTNATFLMKRMGLID